MEVTMKHGDALEKYARSGPDGRSTPAAIRYWQKYASENSAIAPRAKDGPMRLDDTSKPAPREKE